MSITCNEEETLFQLQINVKNDNGYIIMNWKIEDQYGDILHQSGNSNQLFHAYTETTNEEFCLDRSTCYKFSISSNTFRNAGYSLYQDRSLVMSNPGTGGSFSSDDYRIDDKYLSCVTSSPSISPTALEESSDVYISMIVGLMFLCAFVAGLIHSWDRCRTNDQRERRQRQQQRTTAAEEEETRKQNRRFKILTGIIHKKVLPKPKKEEFTTNLPEPDIEIVLPHEAYFSNRDLQKVFNSPSSRDITGNHSEATDSPSKVVVQKDLYKRNSSSLINTSFSSIIPVPFPFPRPSDHEEESNDETLSDRKQLKDDIHAPSMRSIRGVMGIRTESTSSLYSPKACPICMETYKVGEEIAWSKNEGCYHAFHLDCISAWLLLDNDDCPMCRRDFLCVEP